MVKFLSGMVLHSAAVAGFLATAPLGGGPAAAAPAQTLESYHFDFRAGDTLIVQNDYGRIRATPWEELEVEITIRTIANQAERLESVSVACQKVGDKIFVQAYFFDYSAESIDIDIRAPAELNLTFWSANAAVELEGFSGVIRAQSLTGFILATNISGSSSLYTQHGNVIFNGSLQPTADIRLESLTGNVNCRISKALNLRAWLRAGRTASWNREVELERGALERQLGVGGPLLLAASGQGNVLVSLENANTGNSSIRANPAPDSPATGSVTEAGYPADRRPEPPSEDHSAAAYPETPAVREAETASTPDPRIREGGGEGYSLRVNVDWVYLNASVRDRYNGRAIPNLARDDFQVYENGIRQEIEKFDSTEAPFNLLLLLDVSGSTKSFLGMVKRASIEFTRMIKSADRIAVATFNSRTRLRQDFTNDRDQVEGAIDEIRSGGGTAFYDALDRCVRQYMESVEGRKAIVVFTDGVDNQLTGDFAEGSTISFGDLYREIEEQDTLIYTIFLDTEDQFGGLRRTPTSPGKILTDIIFGRGGVPLPGGRDEDEAYQEARRQLELIADQTGGRMYSPTSIQDLAGVYGEIADDLRVQYTLGYNSQNPVRDGSWRALEVKIANRRDLVVRSRKGYYAGRE